MKPFEFINRVRRVNNLKRELPDAIGKMAVGHFKANFKKQGFDDTGVKRWPARKNNKDVGRAILVKTGNLRNSIFVRRANFNVITISSDTKYGQYHNEGTNRLPQRKFMGESESLKKKIVDKVTKEIKNALLGR